jgi:hypothetical protein
MPFPAEDGSGAIPGSEGAGAQRIVERSAAQCCRSRPFLPGACQRARQTRPGSGIERIDAECATKIIDGD